MINLRFIRCKNCGQKFLFNEPFKINPNDCCDVMDGLKRNSRFVGLYDRELIEDFDFLQCNQLKDGEWEYTIKDNDKYNKVLDFLNKYDVVFARDRSLSSNIENPPLKCPTCGSEEFYSFYRSSMENGIEDKDGHGYIYDLFDSEESVILFGSNDDIINNALRLHRYEDSETIEPQYEELLEECKNSVDLEQVPYINSNNIDIKKYLEGLLKIKTAEYSIEQRLKMLLVQRLTAKQNYINAECIIRKHGMEDLKRNIDKVNDSISAITDRKHFSIPLDWYVNQHIEKPVKPEKPANSVGAEPSPPEYKKPGLFNKKAVLAENEALKAAYDKHYMEWKQKKSEYEISLSQYEEKTKEYVKENEIFKAKEDAYTESEYMKWVDQLAVNNLQLKKLLEEREEYESKLADSQSYIEEQIKNCPAVIVRDLTELELNNCIGNLKKAYQIEEEYLAPKILYPKYATLTAVSTMYEYFLSGRCSELTGASGAYSLFESEIRANSVIEQLEYINEKLNQIKSNQYMLYQAIQSAGSQLSLLNRAAEKMTSELRTMNSTFDNIRECAAVTAYNTATTAYYSKMNAQLTDSLGYLIAMKS